jgi:hypothetical protein
MARGEVFDPREVSVLQADASIPGLVVRPRDHATNEAYRDAGQPAKETPA